MNTSTIFLYGPSGSGKSTVGKILADSLNLSFIDLDLEIEAQSGKPIPEIFAAEGESAFREWEYWVLERVLTPGEQIISLGGGALTINRCRELAEAHGQVVMLNAPPETLLSRLRDDSVARPLLAGDAEERLRSMLVRRGEHYASFDVHRYG